jgi:hypothetical protein
VNGALRDVNTAGLDLATYGPPRGPLSTAPPTTDGTCFGDYQALPGAYGRLPGRPFPVTIRSHAGKRNATAMRTMARSGYLTERR